MGSRLLPTQSASITPVRTLVRVAIERAWHAAGLGDRGPVEVELDRPAKPEHGDLATNLALKLARPLRRSPMDIAAALRDALVEPTTDGHALGTGLVARAEVASPGFLNLWLADGALAGTIAEILERPSAWGTIAPTHPRRVNVEFVSANPTGPLHIGNARGAFVGDLLCRVLEAGGQSVTREYYFNDAGGQITVLGASVAAIRRGEPLPADAYRGAYVEELARSMPASTWHEATAAGVDTADVVGRWAAARVRQGIEASLDSLGVHFDVWTSEARLHEEGWVDRAIALLRDRGHLYELDGALWFRSTTFGDDKDRVVLRSDGRPTYFAADLGYLVEKFERGFDHLIYIWGADHHGTVARLRNAATALGYGAQRVQVILYSWVRFVRDGVEISMSKRAGEFVTLDELLAEVGVDAARWSFASRAPTSAIDFDIELAKRQSAENPVYYVQYAHARIASILRKASEAGLAPAAGVSGVIGADPEGGLARQIIRFPEIVEDAVSAEETQVVCAYATDLATQFHAFYRDARVVDPTAPERSGERLALALATRTTLANALQLLGIGAPDSM
jgi:arginyl-tRNA synthetase